ncbi:MAG: bifunctional DNA primase/polymerase [Candidatus Omnitrophota bacterium]
MNNVANNVKKMDSKIPYQLQKDGFGFVKLKDRTKKPFEQDWQNNPYSLFEIEPWFESGNNFGVLGGCGDLIIIDADTEEISTIVKAKFPDTFTVKTRKGFHYYYLNTDIQKKIVLKKGDEHFGEVISTGSQVVAPGSVHPDTGMEYMVVNDVEIATVTKDNVFKALAKYINVSEIVQKEFKERFEKIVLCYGEPYYVNGEGIVTSINQSFWAGLNMAEHIQLYEPDEKSFYRYDEKTGLFSDFSDDVIKQDISQRLLSVSRENNLPTLERKRTIATLNNITAHLKGIAEKKYAFEYKHKDFIHLKNGVLKIQDDKTVSLVNFSPDFCSRNQSPIAFDAEAKCERFLNELLCPAVSEEDAVLVQKYAGLCILGENLIQRFMILGGDAGRGKSQLSLILQELVGLQNVTEIRTHHLRERFELYRYIKKTLLVGVDVPANFLTQKGAYVIKGLTGGDCFDTEKKGSAGSFQIKGNYCIVMTSNSKLHVRLEGDIEAWRRRLLLIDYNLAPPKKKIPNFGKKLIQKEGSGILNWALRGLKMIWDDIDQHGDLVLGDDQIARIDGLLAESDSLRHFLNEEVIKQEHSDLTVSEVEEAYADYCPRKGWNPKHITAIRRELEGLFLELFGKTKAHSIERKGRDQRGFRGVAFKGGKSYEY